MIKTDEKCSLLPDKITTKNKKLDEIIEEASNILIEDFSMGKVVFRGKRVVGIYPYTNKESYKHILKLDDGTATKPQLVERALRCKQYACLLNLSSQKSCCKEFMCWKEYDIKRSRWTWCVVCPLNKILIVLGEMKESFILVTAYHLLGKGLEKQIKKNKKSKNKQ